MFLLSLNTFRERWQLFVGAVLSVAVGVALVQSSLLVLAATGTPRVPEGLSKQDASAIREGYVGAATVMGMTVFLSVFLTVFIVSSTFAFTVAQRRRDLALLRLVGGSRGQVRRLLLSEALLLGVVGTGLGVPIGFAGTSAQSWLLIEIGLLPEIFEAGWESWALTSSAVVGIGVALLGVLSASLRAARVRPLEALRDTGQAARVMTPWRWFFGLSWAAATAGMLAMAGTADLLGAMMVALGVSMSGAVALSLLSPLVVPLVARVLVLRVTTLGGLAEANLRDGVRRSASTAAPLIVLVSLLLGLTGTFASLAAATGQEQQRLVDGDLVVDSTGANADRIAAVPGVALASKRTAVPVTLTAGEETYESGIVAVDDAYARTHRLPPRAGELDRLRGLTVVTGPATSSERIAVGSTVIANIAGREASLTVVAALPETLEAGDSFLLPRELVPAELLANAPTETVVQVAGDPAQVAARIEAAGIGRVRTVAEWAEGKTDSQQSGNIKILAVLMGLSGLYALMAVINAVVIAAAERRTEFAVARVTGLTRRQVVRMAVLESCAVTVIGLLLGCAVAGAGLAAIGTATKKSTGTAVVAVPWELLGAVTAGAFLVVGATSLATALAATRAEPVRLVAARE